MTVLNEDTRRFTYIILPCLTLPYLTLPYLTLPYLTLPYLALPYLTLPYLTLPYLTLPYLTLPCLALPCLTLPCLTLPYLTLPYLTLSFLANMFHFIGNNVILYVFFFHFEDLCARVLSYTLHVVSEECTTFNRTLCPSYSSMTAYITMTSSPLDTYAEMHICREIINLYYLSTHWLSLRTDAFVYMWFLSVISILIRVIFAYILPSYYHTAHMCVHGCFHTGENTTWVRLLGLR